MSWAESRHPPSRHPYLAPPKNPQLENLKCWPVSHPLGAVWLQALPAQPVHCGLLLHSPVTVIGHPPRLVLPSEVCRCGCLQT